MYGVPEAVVLMVVTNDLNKGIGNRRAVVGVQSKIQRSKGLSYTT